MNESIQLQDVNQKHRVCFVLQQVFIFLFLYLSYTGKPSHGVPGEPKGQSCNTVEMPHVLDVWFNKQEEKIKAGCDTWDVLNELAQ